MKWVGYFAMGVINIIDGMNNAHMSPLLFCIAACCHGYPSYQNNIPNGHKVPHPCGGNNEWGGVGHQFSKGGGPLNPFGIDLYKNKLDNRQVIIFLKSAILK
jgi:hypothetical protein